MHDNLVAIIVHLTMGDSSIVRPLVEIAMAFLCRIIKFKRVQQATIISSYCSNLIWGIMFANIFQLPFYTSSVLSSLILRDECRWLDFFFTPSRRPYFLCGIWRWVSFPSLCTELHIQAYFLIWQFNWKALS